MGTPRTSFGAQEAIGAEYREANGSTRKHYRRTTGKVWKRHSPRYPRTNQKGQEDRVKVLERPINDSGQNGQNTGGTSGRDAKQGFSQSKTRFKTVQPDPENSSAKPG